MDDYKYFSQLCESIVSEASTTMAQFNGPGAQEVLKQLEILLQLYLITMLLV